MTDTPEPNDGGRAIPVAQYAVTYPYGRWHMVRYTDDEADAMAFGEQKNGRVERHVLGLIWETLREIEQ